MFVFGQTGANLPENINSDSIGDDTDLLMVLLQFSNGGSELEFEAARMETGSEEVTLSV